MGRVSERTSALLSHHEWMRRLTATRLAFELRETAKLALPVVLTHIAQIAMMTTDLALIGQISTEALAGAALAGRIYLISFTFGVGPLAAIAPIAARAFAANNRAVIRRSLRMGLWAALLLSFPMMGFALCGEKILLSLGQPPSAAGFAREYLLGLVWGAAPALCFLAMRSFMSAVGRPEPALWITLTAIPVNALLVYVLVNGKLGFPRLELFGAGLATTLVNCVTFFVSFWFAAMHRSFRQYHVLGHFWRFDRALLRQLIHKGFPISIDYLMGYGLFSAAALLAGLVGTRALAAHQIAFQVTQFLFMISLGIGMAAAVRVGHAIGRNDAHGIKWAGLAGMLLGIISIALLTLIVLIARFTIVEIFLDEAGHDANATIELAARLLLVGSGFFIVDALKNVATGALRGLNDTRMPLLFAGVAYWLIGFSVSCVLSLKTIYGVIGIWIGISLGTTIYAGLLVARFQFLTNRLYRQMQC